jgi:hypothetical protein
MHGAYSRGSKVPQFWQIYHIKIKANFDAHGLAKFGVKQIFNTIWIEEIPSCIHYVVILEKFALVI